MYVLELVFFHLICLDCFHVSVSLSPPFIYLIPLSHCIIFHSVGIYIQDIYIFLCDEYLIVCNFSLANCAVHVCNYLSRVVTEKWNHQFIVYVYFYINLLSSSKAVPVYTLTSRDQITCFPSTF